MKLAHADSEPIGAIKCEFSKIQDGRQLLFLKLKNNFSTWFKLSQRNIA